MDRELRVNLDVINVSLFGFLKELILFPVLSHLNFIFIVCVYVHVHASQNMYKDQRITYGSWFFPSGFELRGTWEPVFYVMSPIFLALDSCWIILPRNLSWWLSTGWGYCVSFFSLDQFYLFIRVRGGRVFLFRAEHSITSFFL